MSKVKTMDIGDELLSAQRALLGVIGDSIAGVAIAWEGEELVLEVYHINDLSEDVIDDFECAVTEIASDIFDAIVRVSFRPVGETRLRSRGRWVFLRKGFAAVAP